MAFFATFCLLTVSLLRPMEIWSELEAFKLINVFTGLAVVGVSWDLFRGKRKNLFTPQLPLLAIFVVWSYVSTIAAVGMEAFSIVWNTAVISSIFMLVVMYASRTHPRLFGLLALLGCLGVFVGGVAVDMGRQSFECIEYPQDDDSGMGEGTADGRECSWKSDCVRGGKSDVTYGCEKPGMFKTFTIYGRVRWKGQLADPNDLSVFIGTILPLLLLYIALKRSALRIVVALAGIGVGLYAIILAQSRGGQLVVGAIFAAFFVQRYKKKGLILGLLMALPVILLGGRSDGEDSTDERADLLYSGINDAIRHPILGIGINQFADTYGHTAHNAYLLASVETGFPGLVVWSSLVWSSLKIPLTVVRKPPEGLNPNLRFVSFALLSTFIGMTVGIFFLSFTFKQILFVWLGICGALYGIVRNEHETFEVKFELKDLLYIVLADVGVLSLIFVIARMKAGHG